MKKLNNPFVVYGYKGAEYFCDRQKEASSIKDALNNERNIVLVAPRRIGKTGLIQHVFSTIGEEESDVKCIYIDIYSTQNLQQFVETFAKSIIGTLDTPTQSSLRKITTFFSSCRPTVSFDPLSGMPTVSLDIVPNQEEQTLKRIFEYIKDSGHRCFIAIDEFQQILNYPEKGIEALLRSYIQFVPNAYFIFSGSQQHLMAEMFTAASRPFYQSSQVITLNAIDENVYYGFANHFMQSVGTLLSVESFHHLYSFFEGITWYIQAALNRLYEKRYKEIDNLMIDSVINELVEEQTPIYQNYLPLLTAKQIELIAAISKEGKVKSPTAQGFIQKYHLSAPSSIKTAITSLINKGILCQTSEGYVVCDKFMTLWFRHQ